jgi:hypothetical protein
MVAESGPSLSQRWFAVKDAAVKPGEVTNVGDVKFK